MPTEPGTLYVVATPIGNLADLGQRARAILGHVDFIAAEDTRHTAGLLRAHALHPKLLSLHEHNEAERAAAVIRRLAAGETAALVSDAGTPLVSDPGYRLVRAAQDAGIAVRAVPGPSAVTAALSVAGIPTDRWVFEGFLPAARTARGRRLADLRHESRTLVFYEAPHRLRAMLEDCAQAFGADREAALARELTKVHESVLRMPLGELVGAIASGREPARGECVVLIAGATRESAATAEQLLDALLGEGLAPKTAAAVARRVAGGSRRELYRRAVARTSGRRDGR